MQAFGIVKYSNFLKIRKVIVLPLFSVPTITWSNSVSNGVVCDVHGHLVRHRLARALIDGCAVVRVVREVSECTVTDLTQRACYVLVSFSMLCLVQHA